MDGISPGRTVSALRPAASAGDTSRRGGQTATTRSQPRHALDQAQRR